MAHDTGQLLSAAADGDQAAWDELVARYNNMLWSIARSFRINTADAADAVQTTWLRLVENLDRINDPDRLPGWLATTVRRECLRILRKGRTGAPIDIVDDLPDGADPLDTALLTDERDAALWRAVGRISQRCQELLRVLMSTPPPTYVDVSAALEMPIGSIGPSRARCLDQLRRVAGDDDLLGAGEAR